jgi:uncharacterized protein YndB with AHSA1/START domain
MGIRIGVLHVRRSIFINAAPARVWQEFETFERVAAWLGRGHRLHSFEPRVGATVDMSVEIDGVQRHFGGAVLIFDAEREVTFQCNWQPPLDWPIPMLWTIRLTPLYDGTLAEIFHHGFERLGADAADNLEAYEDGWDIKHLKALRAIVAA